MFHAYVGNVLSGCFVRVVKVFNCFMCFFASASDAFFKCFICHQTYVANILYGCFKNRSDVARVAMATVAGGQRPAAGLRLLLALGKFYREPNRKNREPNRIYREPKSQFPVRFPFPNNQNLFD